MEIRRNKNLYILACIPAAIFAPFGFAAETKMPPKANAEMQAVLDELTALNGKPIETLSPEEARKQPTPADAVMALMKKKSISPPEKSGTTEDIMIKLEGTELKTRVYQPEGPGPFPVIFYIHGGGWVIADLDVYDSTPRGLSKAAKAVVVSTHYRQAPEHKFPAAHMDAFGSYQWTLKNADKYKGDPGKIAVVGESAGGNMAAAVCMMALEKGVQMPVHQVLIYPVADTKMNTPSYIENAAAKPLSAPMMKWFANHTFTSLADASDPRVALLEAKSLKGLPPATIITAQIDPLRSEGEALAKKLEEDGVQVTYKNFDGVTHEFFGMGTVVAEAKEANQLVVTNLGKAFDRKPDEKVNPK